MIIRWLGIILACAVLLWFGKGLVDHFTTSLAATFWWMQP